MGIGNGGTDLSDGLAADLTNMCLASKVGARIFTEDIPVAKQTEMVSAFGNTQPWMYSMASGGDFQFIATVNRNNAETMRGLGFKKIGIITVEDITIEYAGGSFQLPNVGHRDANQLSFREEVSRNLATLIQLCHE